MGQKLTVGELNRQFAQGGWRSASLEQMCKGCGEERLVTTTTIHGRTEYYCNVCSRSWYPPDDTRLDVNGVVMTDP